MTTTARNTRNTTTDLLSQQQDQITKIRNTQTRLRKGRAQINKLAKTLQTLLDNAQVEAQVGCWTDAYYDRTEVVMYADIRGAWIDSLRHPTLLALFDRVEEKIGAFDQTQDHTWMTDPTRSYSLTVPLGTSTTDTTLSARIKITVYVAGDSPTCRKVQTGVKIESVPVYEIQCA